MAATPPLFNGIHDRTPRQAAHQEGVAPENPPLNGHPAKIEEQLSETLSAGYRPNLPVYYFRDEYFNPFDFYVDLEAMLRHDAIKTPLANVKAPVAQSQISVEANSTPVAKFLVSEWERFKQIWLPKVQDNAYPYGWMGAEVVYDVEDGKRVQSDFKDFGSRDVQPLVRNGSVVGVQVRNVPGGTLWLSGSDKGVPAKGFWYAHQATNGRHYGQSQIQAAWKPWRRLTGRDGLEEVQDIAAYRFGTGTVVIGYPAEDVKATNQAATYSSSGRISAQQRAQELGENAKAGGSIAIPTTTYPQSGNPKWTYTVEQAQTNIAELLEYDDALYQKCSKAIGWPPELTEASETGSGYSGRQIPLEGFLMTIQPTAQALFWAWFVQIGRPLVWWNFGPKAWVRPKVIPLLQTYKSSGQPGAQQQAQPDAAAAQTPQPQPEPQPDAQGRIPYKGPRGGSGWKDAQGRIHYATGSSKLTKTLSSAAWEVAVGCVEDEDVVKFAAHIADLDNDELAELESVLESEAA